MATHARVGEEREKRGEKNRLRKEYMGRNGLRDDGAIASRGTVRTRKRRDLARSWRTESAISTLINS